jgi:hypothetical protein
VIKWCFLCVFLGEKNSDVDGGILAIQVALMCQCEEMNSEKWKNWTSGLYDQSWKMMYF